VQEGFCVGSPSRTAGAATTSLSPTPDQRPSTSVTSPLTPPLSPLSPLPSPLPPSGDRSGNLIVWDAATGAEAWRLKKAGHAGHVTSLAWWDAADSGASGCFVSGGQVCVHEWLRRTAGALPCACREGHLPDFLRCITCNLPGRC